MSPLSTHRAARPVARWQDARLRIEQRPVYTAMTPGLIAVPPWARVRVAAWVLRRTGTSHLPVLSDQRLVGVLSESDLRSAPFDQTVVHCMSPAGTTVHARTTLAEAAELMADEVIDCLPVVAGEMLLGLVTRADLRRAGMPEEEVAEPVCASCGEIAGVHADPRTGTVPYCADCLERAGDEVEIGGSG